LALGHLLRGVPPKYSIRVRSQQLTSFEILGTRGYYRLHLSAENLALRQQLAVLQRSSKRLKLRPRDRVFWTWLTRLWPKWRSALIIVKPETVIRWHRQGFRLYWR